MERRKFVKLSGIASAGLLTAGCMGDGDQATATGDVTDTTTTTDAEAADAETTGTDDDLPDIDGELGDSPEGLDITNRELFRTNGEVGLRATVENVGNRTYEYVEAEVTLQDDQGEILYEFIDETEEDDIRNLAPGDTWDFRVVFEEAQMNEVTNYTINLDGDVAQTTGDEGADDGLDIDGEIADDTDPNFEIVSHDFTRLNPNEGRVTGEIRNTGDETANSVEVSVTLYDAQDDQIDIFTNSLEEEEDVNQIAPDETWNFDVRFTDIDMQNVGYYVVSVDSDLV